MTIDSIVEVRDRDGKVVMAMTISKLVFLYTQAAGAAQPKPSCRGPFEILVDGEPAEVNARQRLEELRTVYQKHRTAKHTLAEYDPDCELCTDLAQAISRLEAEVAAPERN